MAEFWTDLELRRIATSGEELNRYFLELRARGFDLPVGMRLFERGDGPEDAERLAELVREKYFAEKRLARIMAALKEWEASTDTRWPSSKNTAALLGVKPSQVSKLVKAEVLKTNGKKGKARRIDPDSITEYRREQCRREEERAAADKWGNGQG